MDDPPTDETGPTGESGETGATGGAAPGDPGGATSPPPRSFSDPAERRVLIAFAVPMAILQIVGLASDALAPTLLVDAPGVLISMNPRLRNLVLVSPQMDVVPFFVIGIGRLLLSDPLFFAFGRRYREAGIRWAEKNLGSPRLVRDIERWFGRASYAIVAISPNNIICLLAGATGMSWGIFLALNVGGTVLRMVLIRTLSSLIEGPILDFTGWVGDRQLLLTVISVAFVAVVAMRAQRRGGRPSVETPEELQLELEDAGYGVAAPEEPRKGAPTDEPTLGPDGRG